MTMPDTHTAPTRAATSSRLLLITAVGFLIAYVATSFAISGLASSSLPLPDDPTAQVRDWYADNPLAAVMGGVCQLVSVAFLAGFVRLLGRAQRWGHAAVALMVLCSVTTWVLAAIAPDASLDTVSVLRDVNFILGGTAHVVALGIFVWLASRQQEFGRRLRGLGWVALVPSVASLISLVVYEGAALILLGRLLCMVWVVSAAVGARRASRGLSAADSGRTAE